LPDLIPIEIKWSPENPRQGDTVQLSVVVKNIGDTATMAGYGINSYFHINGTQVGWVHDTSLYKASVGVNEEIELPFDRIFSGRYFTYPRYSAGDYTVRATIDRDLLIEEKDDDNNVLEVIITYGPPRLPDLALSNLSWAPGEPVEEDLVTFSAYLKNMGELDITDEDTVKIKWMIGEEVIDSLIFTDGLALEDSVLITGANAWASVAGEVTITISADVDSVLVESDETNNSISHDLVVSEKIIEGINNLVSGQIILYPNPADNYLRVNYVATEYITTQLRITNILGEMIMNEELNLIPGTNSLVLNVEDLPGGMYFIKIGSDSVRFVVK
jgi:subtilase family serine protease